MKKIFTLLVACVATLSAFAQSAQMYFIGNSDFYIQGQKESTITNTVKDTMEVYDMNMVSKTANIIIPAMHYPMPGSGTIMTIPAFTIKGAEFTFANMVATFAEQVYSTTTTDASGATKNVEGTISGTYSNATGALNINCTVKYGTMWTVMNMVVVYESTGYYTLIGNEWGIPGRGTAANPFRIFEAADFAAMAKNISAERTGTALYFQMMNDIDFGGSESSAVQLPAIGKGGITNIQTVNWGFQGTFDGNSKTISGIYHTNNGNDDAGKFNALFSSLGEGGVVKNLTFSATNYINSYNYAAPFVSINKGGSVENCVNYAPITAANAFAGGICGYLAGGKGTVKNCTNYGEIKATTYASGICAGTQSGASVGTTDADYKNYIIDNCVNNGTISTGVGAGGIVGSYSGVVTNCTNEGTVTGTGNNAGGIVSCMTYVGGVSGNTNKGAITGKNYVGGVVGYIMKGSDEAFDVSQNTNEGTYTATATTGTISTGAILGGTARTQKTTKLDAVERATATGSYGTICLQFPATATGVQLLTMNGKSSEGIVFDFVDGTNMEAGVPYLYKATEAAQTFTMAGAAVAAPIEVNKFIGTFTDKTNVTDVYVLDSSDNLFHPAGSYVDVDAYKCYINSKDLSDVPAADASTAKSGVVFGIYGGATAINNVDANTSTTSARAKADGKFIQNGKLVIVKNGKQYNAAGAQVK